MRKVRLGVLFVVVGAFIAVSAGRGHAATALTSAARERSTATSGHTTGHHTHIGTHAAQQEIALLDLRGTRDGDGSLRACAVPVGPGANPRLHSRPGPKLAHCDNGSRAGATIAPSRAPPRLNA